MVHTVFQKLIKALDDFKAKRLPWLPLGGKYIELLKNRLLQSEASIVAILESASQDGGDYDATIRIIGDFLMRAPMPLSLIWLAPFKSLIVMSLVEFLLRAKPEIFASVIAMKVPKA